MFLTRNMRMLWYKAGPLFPLCGENRGQQWISGCCCGLNMASELNPRCEVFRGYKANRTMVLWGRAFGRGSGLDEGICVEPWGWNSGSFTEGGRVARGETQTGTPCLWPRDALHYLGALPAKEATMMQPLDLRPPVSRAQICPFSLKCIRSVELCY